MTKKKLKHPDLYTIFHPNQLIGAKKDSMSMGEIKTYHEVLTYNHKTNPEQLTYKIKYEYVFDVNDKSNLNKNKRRIAESLQKRSFYLDKAFMNKYFGEKKDTSINPFPTISFDDDNLEFEITLHSDFKAILATPGISFTKGDIETTRTFEKEVTNGFYWFVRQKQTFKKTWEGTPEELKEEVSLDGKYEEFKEFRRKALDPAQEELLGTWAEFNYKLIKGGRGGAVKKIVLYFSNGTQEEEDKKEIGHGFAWEKKLLLMGLLEESIKIFRQRVKVNQETVVDGKNIYWDSLYIETSIQAAKKEYEEREKSKSRKKIADKAAWLYEGLEKGYWLDFIIKEREFARNAVQKTLFEDTK